MKTFQEFCNESFKNWNDKSTEELKTSLEKLREKSEAFHEDLMTDAYSAGEFDPYAKDIKKIENILANRNE